MIASGTARQPGMRRFDLTFRVARRGCVGRMLSSGASTLLVEPHSEVPRGNGVKPRADHAVASACILPFKSPASPMHALQASSRWGLLTASDRSSQ